MTAQAPVAAGMLGYVVLLEHLQRLMYLYRLFTVLQTVSIVLLMMTFWRKWCATALCAK